MSDTIKHFNFFLPVYKQGDDFADCLHQAKGDGAEAFKLLATRYEAATSMCKRMAGFMKENPEFTADGQSHGIYLEGSLQAAEGLVADRILEVEEIEDWEDELALMAEEAALAALDEEDEDNTVCADYDSDLCTGTFALQHLYGVTGGWDPSEGQ